MRYRYKENGQLVEAFQMPIGGSVEFAYQNFAYEFATGAYVVWGAAMNPPSPYVVECEEFERDYEPVHAHSIAVTLEKEPL